MNSLSSIGFSGSWYLSCVTSSCKKSSLPSRDWAGLVDPVFAVAAAVALDDVVAAEVLAKWTLLTSGAGVEASRLFGTTPHHRQTIGKL